MKRNFGNEIPQELSFKVVTETEWKELQPFSRTEPIIKKLLSMSKKLFYFYKQKTPISNGVEAISALLKAIIRATTGSIFSSGFLFAG